MENELHNKDIHLESDLKTKRKNDKTALSELNSKGQFGTVSEPRKSLATFFRNQNKFEVSGVAILDRKASILIRMCATGISGVIAFNKHIENNVEGGVTISIILILGLSAALILSILATRPNTKGLRNFVKKHITPLHPNTEENIFYVWDNESLEEYEKAMEKVIKSQDLQIGNQIRANYTLGRKNVLSSLYIDYAYYVFLASFILSGFVFMLATFVIS